MNDIIYINSKLQSKEKLINSFLEVCGSVCSYFIIYDSMILYWLTSDICLIWFFTKFNFSLSII